MTATPIVCRLIPIEEDYVADKIAVELPDKETVILGRNATTGIKDKRLSRHQVEVTANAAKKTLKCKQLGSNPCLINKEILAHGEEDDLHDGGALNLLLGRFQYKVEFVENPVSTTASINDLKDEKSTCASPAERSNNGDGAEKEDQPESAPKSQKRPFSEDTPSSDTQSLAKRSKLEKSTTGNGESVDDKLAALRKQAEKYEKKKMTSPQKSKAVADSTTRPVVQKEAEKLKQGGASKEAEWLEKGSLVVYDSGGVRPGNWIAGFDMDGTIITTQSGKVFPTSIADWRILYPQVPGKLKKLVADGYKIVFITNQLGVGRGKVSLSDMKKKVTNIIKKVGVPVQVLMSTGPGLYRKPAIGMWDYLLSGGNDGISVDTVTSFFVGDAAGRPVDWQPKKKKDFSCSDRLFALNIGLRFFTPEEYFLGHKKAKFSLPTFDPRRVNTDAPLLNPSTAELPSSKQEVLLLVGYPASGKSTFVEQHLLPHNYVHVNRDKMGTWQKCVSASNAALNRGKSVVVDNTNPDMEARQRYIECAKRAKVRCRCFVFNVTLEQAKHNERVRYIECAKRAKVRCRCFVFNVTLEQAKHNERVRYIECAKRAKVRCRCFVFNVTLEQAKHNERVRYIECAKRAKVRCRCFVFNVTLEQAKHNERVRYIECAKRAKVRCRCFVFNVTLEQAKHNERFRQMTDSGKNHATIKDMVFYGYRNKYIEPSMKEGFDEVAKVNFIPKFDNEKDRQLYTMFLMEK
ncbi:bifunctional polynucleotide phosphatase/kinase-like isoform X2 [Amphiura filiformis]|uniref:bifunctional polynucleotide phosphatase/kinase-like isoform X2 n=1 Tax=Amphiura filiformis TaxID=82378 RepID=UPI003B226135